MNMSISNIILFILIFLSFAYSDFLMVLFLKRDRILHYRKNINYNNYSEYKKYFNLTISKKIVIFTFLSIILNIVLGLIIIYNDAMNVYLIMLGSLIILDVIGLVSYLLSVKYNSNLIEFDEYFKMVESSYKNKDKIIKNIQIIDNKFTLINNDLDKIYKKVEELVVDFKGFNNIDECFKPLYNIKKEQEEILLSFNDDMPKLFTKALIKYLKNDGKENSESYLFNPNIELNIDPIISTISNKIKDKYLNYLKDAFVNLKHKNSLALIEILNILENYKLIPKNYIEILLNVVNKDPKNNKPVIKYLFDKKCVNYNLIITSISQNSDWVLDYPIVKLITKNELTKLVEEIIKKNNINITNKFLMLVDKSSLSNIKNGIEVANLNNDSTLIMRKYIELLALDGGFNSVANRYENLALTLKNYFSTKNVKEERIDNIINQGSYYENKQYLNDKYNEVLSQIESVLNKTFKSMLCFTLYGIKNFKYFDQNKINETYVEYKRLLNIEGLLCLSSLLDAISLSHTNDPEAYSIIKKAIDEFVGDSLYEHFYPITANKMNNIKLYSKDIIQSLFKSNKNELSTLINHIENERLVLDKIRYM